MSARAYECDGGRRVGAEREVGADRESGGGVDREVGASQESAVWRNVEVLVESGPTRLESGPNRIGSGPNRIGGGGSGLVKGSPYNHPPSR